MIRIVWSRFLSLRFCCCLLMPVAMPVVCAQQASDTIAGKTHAIPEVGVEGRRMPVSYASTSPLQQMKKQEWERLGVTDLGDALRYFSGVQVKDYGGVGGLKTVSVRSLGAQHTAVSYDGVVVSDCQSGQVDISRFSLNNVGTLILNIGQSDNIYQTAKMFASAGALSIETIRPDFEERPYSLAASFKAGSYGLLNPSLFYARQLYGRHVVSAYLEALRADGSYPFTMKNEQTLIRSKRNNSDIRTYRAEANLAARLSSKQDLGAKLYLFDSDRGLPGGVIYDNPYTVERLYDRNYFGQLKYENRFSERWKMQANGKFNYTWNRNHNVESSGITDDRFRQTETYLSATLWHSPLEGLSVSLAQDFAHNYLSTTLENAQYPKRYTLLTALAAHYRGNRFTATASLLNTFITENVRTGEAAPDRKHLSPALSLSWKPFDFGLRLRMAYKDIFRVPTFNDLYYRLIGNSKLRPESTRQINVGATWAARPSSRIDFLSLSFDAYYNRVTDKIVAIPTMFVWKMMNVGKVETLGVDVNWAAEKAFSPAWRIHLTGTYNLMFAEDVTDRSSKTWRNQIIYTPKHSGSNSLTLGNPYADLTFTLTYASERFTLGQNLPSNRIEPYTDFGLSLSRSFRRKKQELRLQLDARNLGGRNYEIVRFYPMPGRHYRITIQYNL